MSLAAPDIEDLHQAACAARETFYTDPASGFLVFTAYHLSQRPCCSSGCRHCPHRPRRAAPAAKILSGSSDDLADQVDVLFWSGGKDSFLALRRLQKESVRDVVLLTTYDAGLGVVAHQNVLITDVIRQAKSLALPLLGVPLGGTSYLSRVQRALNKLRDAGIDIVRLAFGDLHLAHVREWRDEELTTSGVELYYPVWGIPYDVLLDDLERARIPIRVSAVNDDNPLLRGIKVGDSFDREFVKGLPRGVDAFGENGEFHTLVELWRKV